MERKDAVPAQGDTQKSQSDLISAGDNYHQDRRYAWSSAAGRARFVLDRSSEVSEDHPFIARYGLKDLGLRQYYEAILIPIYTVPGELISLIQVYPDGCVWLLGSGKLGYLEGLK